MENKKVVVHCLGCDWVAAGELPYQEGTVFDSARRTNFKTNALVDKIQKHHKKTGNSSGMNGHDEYTATFATRRSDRADATIEGNSYHVILRWR